MPSVGVAPILAQKNDDDDDDLWVAVNTCQFISCVISVFRRGFLELRLKLLLRSGQEYGIATCDRNVLKMPDLVSSNRLWVVVQ